MLTSQGLCGDGRRMKEIGFAGFLTKPARPDQLRHKLNQWLIEPAA